MTRSGGRHAGTASLRLLAATLLLAGGAVPAQAGSSWLLPLVGGAVGGYALNSVVNARKTEPPPQPAPPPAPRPVAPPAPAAPAAAPSVQARLQQLDQLAAGGYITKAEYEQRRQAILNTL